MLRLLVVEDFQPLARALRRELRQAGYDVELAASFYEAKQCQGWYDGAIVDMELPDGTGLDVAAEVRACGHAEEILFFTACRDRQMLAAAAEMGRVIDKNAGIPMLLAMLDRCLGSANARRLAIGDSQHSPLQPKAVNQRSGARRIRR